MVSVIVEGLLDFRTIGLGLESKLGIILSVISCVVWKNVMRSFFERFQRLFVILLAEYRQSAVAEIRMMVLVDLE